MDIFYDLDRYDPIANLPLRRNLAEFVRVVIQEEWEELIAGHLSQRAWNLGVIIYTIIAVSNPYSPPGAIEPTAFVEIFQHDMAEMLGIGL